jgi:outer membrane protein TolC
MRRRIGAWLLTTSLAMGAPAAAQTPLTLAEAVARARANNPDAEGSAAAEREAAHRVSQARAGYWPRIDLAETWQRGNQPVFVFGSLLAQRRFTAADFALDALNRPDAVDNFRSALTAEQSLFTPATRAQVASASIGLDMATAHRRLVGQNLAAAVTEAYGRVLVAVSARESADAAAETVRADRELAANRRDAGRVTDADVLQADVQVARTREGQIRAAADESVARARLNQVMGAPLDEVFALDRRPAMAAIDVSDVGALEAEAERNQPLVTLAALQEQLAHTNQEAARAAFLPHVSAQGGWELNGSAWNRRESSWAVGVVARINVFQGFADRARLREAREQASRRVLERQKAITSARLDVRVAATRLQAARESETVGRAAVAQAQESRRIIRDRYEAGLTDVASLLRAAEAVTQAETQLVSAQAAVLTETAVLERTLGRR